MLLSFYGREALVCREGEVGVRRSGVNTLSEVPVSTLPPTALFLLYHQTHFNVAALYLPVPPHEKQTTAVASIRPLALIASRYLVVKRSTLFFPTNVRFFPTQITSPDPYCLFPKLPRRYPLPPFLSPGSPRTLPMDASPPDFVVSLQLQEWLLGSEEARCRGCPLPFLKL